MALLYLVMYWRSKDQSICKERDNVDKPSHHHSFENSHRHSESPSFENALLKNESLPLHHLPHTLLHPILT